MTGSPSVRRRRGDQALVFGQADGKFALTQPAEHPKLEDYKVDDVARALELLTFQAVQGGRRRAGREAGHAVFTTSDGLAVTVTVLHADKDVWARFAVAAVRQGEGGGRPAERAPGGLDVSDRLLEGEIAGAHDRRPEGGGAGQASRTGTSTAPTTGARLPGGAVHDAGKMTDREYPTRPFVGIGIVVIKDDQVLLCQRGKPPNLGSWTLPGGAQEVGETCEEAARRELHRGMRAAGGPAAFLRACRYDPARRRRPRPVPLHDPGFCRAMGGRGADGRRPM